MATEISKAKVKIASLVSSKRVVFMNVIIDK